MDDKLILKILSVIPTDRNVIAKDIPVEEATGDRLYELHQAGLLHREYINLEKGSAYRRSVIGTDWIRHYYTQKYLVGMTLAILLLTLFLAVRTFW